MNRNVKKPKREYISLSLSPATHETLSQLREEIKIQHGWQTYSWSDFISELIVSYRKLTPASPESTPVAVATETQKRGE